MAEHEIIINEGALDCEGEAKLDTVVLTDEDGKKLEWTRGTCTGCALHWYTIKI